METQKVENKVLIVDPEQESLDLYALLLKKNFKVYTAETPMEAYSVLRQHEIKVIIAEHLQREISAIEFFKETSEQYPRSERILITGMIDNDLIGEATNTGKVFHYILKPFQKNNLIGIVEKAIEKYNLQRQNDILIMGLKQSNKELEYLLSKLKSEEEKFRDIFNATKDPILIISKEGFIIEANAYAQDSFAFNPSEFGKIQFLSLVHEDFYNKTMRFMMLLQLSENPLFETLLRTREQEWKSFEINGRVIDFQNQDAVLLILRDTTERKETEKKVLQAIIQTEESERRHFAQELHDGIGPLLSTAKLYLQWLLKPNAKIDRDLALHKIEQTLEETILSVREVSNKLSPNTLVNFGIEAAIKSILERISDISEINCKLNIDIEKRLPFDLEATIFRIIGESINNTIKHAKASHMTIHIVQREKVIDVFYQDDGIGFDLEQVIHSPSGNGLANMKSRVVSMGGTIDLVSKINQGTSMSCKFFL